MSETFVDVDSKPIPPRAQWANMSNNELLAVKHNLQDRMSLYSKNPTIATVVQQGIDQVEALMERPRI